MPVACKLVDGEWKVVDDAGKVHAKHGPDEKMCKKQARAINANMEMGEVNLIICPKDADILQLANDPLTFKKEHAYVGKFAMNAGRENEIEFELTEEALIHIANETNRYLDNGNECNLPIEHTSETEKNRGKNLIWSVEPDSKGRTGLFSITKFRDEEAAKLAKTAQTSIFAPGEYVDGKKEKYVRAVRHVALTDYPVIPGLDGFTPIAASLVQPIKKENNSMAMKDLAGKIGLQLSEDIFKDDTKATEAIAMRFSQLGKEFSDYKLANPPKLDPVRVSKEQVSMLKENRELKLSQLTKDGRITPAVEKNLRDIFCGDKLLELCLSEDRQDNFNSIIAALKENDPIKLSESTGPQGGDLSSLNVGNTVMSKVADRRAKAAASN